MKELSFQNSWSKLKNTLLCVLERSSTNLRLLNKFWWPYRRVKKPWWILTCTNPHCSQLLSSPSSCYNMTYEERLRVASVAIKKCCWRIVRRALEDACEAEQSAMLDTSSRKIRQANATTMLLRNTGWETVLLWQLSWRDARLNDCRRQPSSTLSITLIVPARKKNLWKVRLI